MVDFLRKKMPLDEWAPFQNAFEERFMVLGAPREMAMFEQNCHGEDEDWILITEHDAEFFVRLAPEDWERVEAPTDDRWALLVGHEGIADELGIRLGPDYLCDEEG